MVGDIVCETLEFLIIVDFSMSTTIFGSLQEYAVRTTRIGRRRPRSDREIMSTDDVDNTLDVAENGVVLWLAR